MTNILGVFIFIPVVFEYLGLNFGHMKIDKTKIKPDVFYLLLIPAGLMSYMIFLYTKFGDPFAFLHYMIFWGRSFSSPFTTINTVGIYPTFYGIIFSISVFFAFSMLLYLIYDKRIRLSYLIYFSVFLYLYMSSGLLESIPRFISAIFAIYISMAILSEKHKTFDYIFTICSLMMLCLMVILYVNGYWIT